MLGALVHTHTPLLPLHPIQWSCFLSSESPRLLIFMLLLLLLLLFTAIVLTNREEAYCNLLFFFSFDNSIHACNDI